MSRASTLESPRQRNALSLRQLVGPWKLQRVLTVLIAVLGLGILLYPAAAGWFSARQHASEINGYVRDVENLTAEESEAAHEEARRYNRNLPHGPLRDPWALSPDGQQTAVGDGIEAYFNTLSQLPSDMMGRLTIPKISADLPIYHGTAEKTLEQGVGHLYGSGLPVGGADNHSVLTAHSGLVNSPLFTELHQLEVGDIFTMTVLNEKLYYEVDQIVTVEPDEIDAVRQIRGRDYVTLITCTPIGVNTHRLLVRGERIPAPTEDLRDLAVDGDAVHAGFPWWALGFLTGTGAAVVFTRPRADA